MIENIFPSENKIDHFIATASILTTHKGTNILTQHFKLHLSSTTSLWLFYPRLIPSFEKMRSKPPTDTIPLCILYRPLYSHNLKYVFFI